MEIEKRELYYGGEFIASWPCDYNPSTKKVQSNGGIEVIIKDDDGKKHGYIYDWEYNPVEYTGQVDYNIDRRKSANGVITQILILQEEDKRK